MTKRKKHQGYIQPKITRIKFDPAQAILQQRKVGGIYFQMMTWCRFVPTTGPTMTVVCPISARGQSRATVFSTAPYSSTDAQPS